VAEKTAIAWTNSTWNAAIGCSHVSEGCRFCYAEELATRFGWTKKAWTAPNAAENVILKPHKLDLPLRWQEPRRIFVNSLSDVFHEQISDDYIDLMFAVMAASPRHTYQILTKRPKRMRDYVNALTLGRLDNAWAYLIQTNDWVNRHGKNMTLDAMHRYLALPLDNVWLGTSVEAQREADERIPLLLQTQAVVRFLSCEPLLGPVSLYRWLSSMKDRDDHLASHLTDGLWHDACAFCVNRRRHGGTGVERSIDWAIIGGESGPNFRPMDLDWARSLRDQCVEAGVAFFYKQNSNRRPGQDTLLDGREWHQFPEVV
jgi:protein gp37